MDTSETKNLSDCSRSSLQEIGTLSKVTNLRQRFESFKSDSHAIVKVKPTPPTPPLKSYLIRSETMRDSALIENRKGLQAKYFQTEDKTFDSSDDVIYDNVPISPIKEKDLE